MTAILPVIHYLDGPTLWQNVDIAASAGVDGVFLISHEGADLELPALATEVREAWPHGRVGLNFLSAGLDAAMDAVHDHDLDFLWGDNCGVNSRGLSGRGEELSVWAKRHPLKQVFASVAFKYQPQEADPAEAARQALAAGFIPTTSGSATGSAPTVDKIRWMSKAVGGQLAVASGMTVENVREFAPYLSHILVSTGISLDEHRFDPDRLRAFVNEVRRV